MHKLKTLYCDCRYRAAFVSSLISGIIAHGMALFNHFYYHDDIAQLVGFGVGPVSSGRWFTSLLELLEEKITFTPGWYTTCVPLLNGLISILLIACVSCLLIKFLDIKSIVSVIIISCILCVFPSITCSFGYMSNAPYFMFGLLLGVTGTIMLCDNGKSLGRVLVGILLMVLCISIYQAYIPFMLTLFLMALVKEIIQNPDTKLNDTIRKGLQYVLFAIVAAMLYFLTVKLSLLITGRELSSYKGANDWSLNPLDYLKRIQTAYWRFFIPDHSLFLHRRFIFIIELLFVVASVFTCWGVFKKNRCNGVVVAILLCFFPFAMNFIYIMCPYDTIYAMMLYANTLMFVLLVSFGENYYAFSPKIGRWINILSIVACSIMIYMFVLFDNMCYMKADLCRHQAISYFTTLVSQIKGTPGYSADMKVAFINEQAIKDPTVEDTFYWIMLPPYWSTEEYINDYQWRDYMKLWCGYSPSEADPDEFNSLPEVIKMPPYPNSGSIAVINGTVVVKLGAAPVKIID